MVPNINLLPQLEKKDNIAKAFIWHTYCSGGHSHRLCIHDVFHC